MRVYFFFFTHTPPPTVLTSFWPPPKKKYSYADQLLRRTMAAFYVQFKVDTFKRQMKENRKIEELILMFASHATGVLRKDATLSADGKWNVELNNHIVQFIKLLRESLRTLNHVTPELMARMDMYAAKLAPQGQTQTDSGYDSSSTSHRDSISSAPGTSSNAADMPMVKTVAKLFQIRADLLYPEVDKLRGVCTERVRVRPNCLFLVFLLTDLLEQRSLFRPHCWT